MLSLQDFITSLFMISLFRNLPWTSSKLHSVTSSSNIHHSQLGGKVNTKTIYILPSLLTQMYIHNQII